ncbi:MAG: nucleotidyltransferase domain-containing protein [Planctomycetes bacterium]|nr:nucleotidyltransferase domain-containing protein [Planctomycetota bacterium]
MMESWKTALDRFVDKVRQEYDGRLEKVILYGSRARGSADEGSDVDLLVVLKPLDDFWKELSRLQDLAGPICLEHDVVLSALPVDVEDFDKPKTPLLLNSKREGIRVA